MVCIHRLFHRGNLVWQAWRTWTYLFDKECRIKSPFQLMLRSGWEFSWVPISHPNSLKKIPSVARERLRGEAAMDCSMPAQRLWMLEADHDFLYIPVGRLFTLNTHFNSICFSTCWQFFVSFSIAFLSLTDYFPCNYDFGLWIFY